MDWHRRRDLRLGTFLTRYIEVGLIWALVLAVFGVFIYFLGFSNQKNKHFDLRKLQIAYLSYADISLSKDGKVISAGDEMARSKNIGTLKELGSSAKFAGASVLKKFSDYGERIEEEIKSGKVSLVYVPTWGDFFTDLFTWGLAALWLLVGASIFLSFAVCSFGAAYPTNRLLDLPWQKPWVWIFVIATIPINIPFFAVSAIRILLESGDNIRQGAGQLRPSKAKQNASIRWIKPRKTDVKVVSVNEYVSSKRAWVEIRASKCREKWLGQLELCRKKIAAQRLSLTEYGNIIIRTQGDLAEAQRELRDTEAAEPHFLSDMTNIAQAEDEFERLLNLPAIARVEVNDKVIKVWTHPAIIYIDGQPHDFGSYGITVGVTVNGGLDYVEVRAVFSTKLKGDGHMYGGGRNGNFCFGTRRETIHNLLLRGEYLPAFILMLEGLHYINAENEQQASQLYPGVQSATV